VLLACQGQLRLAPSGHVIGIDMDAGLKIGAARGYDLAVLSVLLPASEAGLVEALQAAAAADQEQSDSPGNCLARSGMNHARQGARPPDMAGRSQVGVVPTSHPSR
jgi:hypothetical protein